MSNIFRQGALMRQRGAVSERHSRAGRLGGERTAQLYPGRHAEWAKKAHHRKEQATVAGPVETPAVGKRVPAPAKKRRGEG